MIIWAYRVSSEHLGFLAVGGEIVGYDRANTSPADWHGSNYKPTYDEIEETSINISWNAPASTVNEPLHGGRSRWIWAEHSRELRSWWWWWWWWWISPPPSATAPLPIHRNAASATPAHDGDEHDGRNAATPASSATSHDAIGVSNRTRCQSISQESSGTEANILFGVVLLFL